MPVLVLESGRRQEFILTPEGNLLSAGAINYHSSIFDGIEVFRFVQNEPAQVTFEYVPLGGPADVNESEIESELRKKLGAAIGIGFERKESIPKTARGKHRFIISTLDLTRILPGPEGPRC
jgi:hypothetical protein